MKQTTLHSLEARCLAGLRAKGYPATSCEMDPAKLKGGYICDTMRVPIGNIVLRTNLPIFSLMPAASSMPSA